MKKFTISAAVTAVLAALALGGGAAAAAAQTPAEPEGRVCYADSTRTELVWNVEELVQTSPGSPERYDVAFDMSQSSSDGSASYTAGPDGLTIATADAGNRKVAGYIATPGLALESARDFALDYSATSGIEPGGQLLVDLNPAAADGPESYLVIESVYGGIWWLSGNWSGIDPASLPHAVGGGGYPNQGSYSEWINAFPDAQVLAAGFSLGSGVTASGTVQSVTAGGTTYSPVMYVPAVPATYEWQVTSTGQGVELPTSSDTVRYVQTGTVEVPTEVEVECGTATECVSPLASQTIVGDGVLSVDGDWAVDEIDIPFTGTVADLGDVLNIVATPLQYVGLHIETEGGKLVFEEEPSYGGKLWSSHAWEGVDAGMGYPAFGTIQEFAAYNADVPVNEVTLLYTHPEASSTAVEAFTIGCTVYSFVPPVTEEPTEEPEPTEPPATPAPSAKPADTALVSADGTLADTGFPAIAALPGVAALLLAGGATVAAAAVRRRK